MQRLTSNTGAPLQPWSEQYLRSMPQLRALELSDVQPELLGALLEDAAGCGQLQELRVATSNSTMGTSSSWAGQGLAALASGPCRYSLRSIIIRFSGHDDTARVAASLAQAAPLLLPGALPQLRELQLDVRVHAASLLPRRSARLQQASRAGAAATQRAPQQELPGGPEQHLQLLVGGLQQAGVQGLGGFMLTEGLGWISDSVRRTAFQGSVGPCRFSGRLLVAW
jgi:hypothetical protein